MICFGPFLLDFKSAAIAQPILEKYLFMALFTLKSLIEITDRSRTHQKAYPDCARKMLASCSLECQKVAKKLPKIQKVATKISKLLPKFLAIFI